MFRHLEVRLFQGPSASTNDHDTVLPPPPTVTTIRDGHTEDNGIVIILIDEIQAIYVPPDFTGTYTIRYQARESSVLSFNSGAADIQTALNAMYGDTINRFVVTNPEANTAYVEFIGPFAGLDMEELVIHVTSAGKPDLFFQLDLGTTEVAEALRKNPSVEASFEVRLHITDPTVIDDPGQDVILFQAPVTIVRPLHWEGLEEAAPINWLFPPNPKDYIPYTQDQVGFGTVNYSVAFGDGVLNDYSIAHDLNSSNLQVSVRQNVLDGLQLTDEEFSVAFDNNNALTIHIEGTAPATNSLIAVILSSGLQAVFNPHTHTIDQIVGLRDLLDSILARLSALEALFATLVPPGGASPFGTDPNEQFVTMDIEDRWDLIPTNRPPTSAKFDPTKLAPPGLLLPAVHDVIDLGAFTANPTTNVITLGVAHAGLVAGQRARINVPIAYDTTILCTFDSVTNIVTATAHGLVNDRRVKFTGGVLPEALSTLVTYYVINSTTNTFQVAISKQGPVLPLLTNGDTAPHHLWAFPEVPAGLSDSVDYFMLAPTTTTFKLSSSIGGTEIEITSAGYSVVTMSSVEEAPSVSGVLPDPGPLAGNVYSVRADIFLRGGSGIRSETVHAGDLIASDGRVWYHVTRSDSPGSNSFYANAMEKEVFRVAINDNMVPVGGVFTLQFNLGLQMFKHDTNVQYMLVVEVGDLPEDVTPTPTGPNLFAVEWNKTPLMQQRIIVTDILVTHTLGAQIVRKSDGTLRTNKKQYSIELAGDVIPPSANCAIRVRLIEFDTEDNVTDASGLIYYTLEKTEAGVTSGSPVAPIASPVP
jgi:hypothetical protein